PRLRREARLQVLEATSAEFSGIDYVWYRRLVPSILKFDPLPFARRLIPLLTALPFHHAVALASLAKPPLTHVEQRFSGAFYTDFRLAQLLAGILPRRFRERPRILDPASGTGVLLVAAVLRLAGDNASLRTEILAHSIYAAD